VNTSPSRKHEVLWLGNPFPPADHDQPYQFGRRPRALAPYPFSTRQFARLLVLRGRIQAGQFAADDLNA
jgi:hypothetical protein